MARDYSLLEQTYRGVQEHLYALTDEYNCRKYFRLNVIPQSPMSEIPWIQLFPDPRRNEQSFKVFIDVEREAWVCKNLYTDEDNLIITPLPVSLSEWVTIWLVSLTLSEHQRAINNHLDGADIFSSRIDGLTYQSVPSSDIGAKFQLWSLAARILTDSAKGNLDDLFPSGGSVAREIAMAQLPSNAEDFWGWVEKGFDKDFSSIGKANVDFAKGEFAELGFPEGYEVDVLQLANDLGEAVAEEAIGEALKMTQRRKEEEKKDSMNKKVLGWVVPLTVGLIIAVGAALGY